MAGRKTLPTELKLAKGTLRKGRTNPAEPKAISEELLLTWQADPDVQEWFERFKNYLRGEGRLSKSHEVVIWQAARRAAEIRALDADILANGRTYWTGEQVKPDQAEAKKPDSLLRGLLKANPAVAQKNEAERHLHGLLSELGLTPASKSKVASAISGKVP